MHFSSLAMVGPVMKTFLQIFRKLCQGKYLQLCKYSVKWWINRQDVYVTAASVCECCAEIPHDEGNPETPDYQFVKWMTLNKVHCSLHIHYFCW